MNKKDLEKLLTNLQESYIIELSKMDESNNYKQKLALWRKYLNGVKRVKALSPKIDIRLYKSDVVRGF